MNDYTIMEITPKQARELVCEHHYSGKVVVNSRLHLGVFKPNEFFGEELVGVLQFEVLEYRLNSEYNVDIKMDRLAYRYVRWIENKDVDMDSLNLTSDTKKVKDLKDRNLLIFQNDWGINWALEHNKGLILSSVGKSED